MREVRQRIERDERVLVTTLTKKMAEDLSGYLLELGFRARYLHSEIDTLERIQIIRQLRLGEYDVLVGVNLLREGLDLPEVSLVAILDADKEGFLRGRTSLIQTIGRAARNIHGKVLMYADKQTEAIKESIDETTRRRTIQLAYNEEHGITPQTISKGISDMGGFFAVDAPHVPSRRRRGSSKVEGLSREELEKLVVTLESKTPRRRRRSATKTDELEPHELEKLAVELEEEMALAAAMSRRSSRSSSRRRAAYSKRSSSAATARGSTLVRSPRAPFWRRAPWTGVSPAKFPPEEKASPRTRSRMSVTDLVMLRGSIPWAAL